MNIEPPDDGRNIAMFFGRLALIYLALMLILWLTH